MAPSSKLRHDLHKSSYTACFHGETNCKESSVLQTRKRSFCCHFLFVVLESVYHCFGNDGFTWGEFTMPSLKVKILDFIMSYLYTMYGHRKPLESSSLMIFTQNYMPQFSKTEHIQLLGFLHYLIRIVWYTKYIF